MARHWRMLILGAALIFGLTPLLWTMLASFGLRFEASHTNPSWRLEPSLDAYREVQVFEARFLPELLTSSAVAAMTALLAISLGFLLAQAIAQQRFAIRGLLIHALLVLSSLPVLAFLGGVNITLHSLGLHDTVLGLILAEAALYAPLSAFVLYGHLRSLPANLSDAARLEGAGMAQILWQVLIPASRPALLAAGVLVFVLSWNQVLEPMQLSTQLKLLPVAFLDVFVFERELEWPTAAAALTASLLPLWAFVAVTHHWLERFSLFGGFEER